MSSYFEDGVDVALFVETLQEEGYSAKLGEDDTGDPRIETRMAGLSVFVYFYGCTGNICKGLQFRCGISMENGLSLEKANEWNRKKRFAKLFLDDEQDPIFDLDLRFAPGGSKAQFVEYITIADNLLAEFKHFIRD